MKVMLDLSPTPILLRANNNGGVVRGAIPEKIPNPIPGFIMYQRHMIYTGYNCHVTQLKGSLGSVFQLKTG